MTRRTVGALWASAVLAFVAPANGEDVASGAISQERPAATSVPAAEVDKLQSEFLFEIVFDKGPTNDVGGNRLVVPVLGGTFEGPKLKGTVVGPGGDWMVNRSDGSSLLDLRLLLQTDDAQKISMTCRGIAYAQPGGTLYARITPLFDTGAEKYGWLNNVVAVGVFRPVPGKVAYRIYRIL